MATHDGFLQAVLANPGDDMVRLVFADWGPKMVDDVPFILVDPQDVKVKNAILLNGPQGKIPPTMPRSVTLPCSFPAKAVREAWTPTAIRAEAVTP